MNSENLVQSLQNGLRVTLGATASLIEVLQDPQKRTENLTKLSQEWDQLSQEWAEKGKVTEQEARSFVDSLLAQQRNAASSDDPTRSATATAPPDTSPTAPPDIQLELQTLTAQIAAIRAELEKLRNQDSTSS